MRAFRFVALASVLFMASVEVQAASPRTSPSDHPLGSGARQPLNWGDFDGDGLADLYLRTVDAPDRLLRNGGDGRFEDVSATALPTASNQSRIALWRDVDGDERLDLILVSHAGELRVLHNHGGFFLEGTEVTGIAYETPVVALRTLDFDADGRLDLELETEAGPSLWHNLGSLAFERVSLDEFDPTTRGASDSVGGNTDLGTAAAAFGNPAPSSTTVGNTNAATDIAPPPDRVPLTPPIANDLRSAAVPGVTKGSSTTPSGTTTALTTIAGTRPFKLALGCAESIHDQVTGKCTLVSTTPAMGRIYPLGPEFNINVAGNVGIGTTTPAAKLDVAGTGHFSDTLTLEPSGDEALDVSAGSIYKDGGLFIHTKGGTGNTAIGVQALSTVTSGISGTASGYRALYLNTTGDSNTANGDSALYSNTTGVRNTAAGASALRSNIAGNLNTATGYEVLFANTTGDRNSGLGAYALLSNTTGLRNTASGSNALQSNTSGNYNTASGGLALAFNTVASRNTATGYRALFTNTSGHRNTASGVRALHFNTTGSRNTASGVYALYSNTTGSLNVAAGYDALRSNTTGSYNTAFGERAMREFIGIRNTAIGSQALRAGSGADNTAIGYRALNSNTSASQNTAIGIRAMESNTMGSFNSASGAYALNSNTTGAQNTASGFSALKSNTIGTGSTATGYRALYSNVDGGGNTAFGSRALQANTTGFFNSAIGNNALLLNISGFKNVATGLNALYFNTSGSRNTASGVGALVNNTTGSLNTVSGVNVMFYNATGSRNIAIGYRALFDNTTGSDNIAIGYRAGHNQTGNSNIAIGHVGMAGESQTIRIGSGQSKTYVEGIRGVTTGMADGIAVLVDSSGQLGTVSSSRRFKQDIRDMGEETKRLLDLRPVVFRYKPEVQAGERPTEYGLIAEEVADVFPDLVVYDQDGQPLTVKYHLLSSMLLNELQKMAESQFDLASEFEELRAMLATLHRSEVPQAMATNTR